MRIDHLMNELLDKMKVVRSEIRPNAEKSLETRKSNYDRAKSRSIKSEFSINEKYTVKKPYIRKVAARNYLKYGRVLL